MKKKSFTLVETVVAIGILGLTLAAFYSLLATAQRRIIKSSEKWNETHMLIEATEYFLLHGPDKVSSIPNEFFPYSDYKAICSNDDVSELPDDYTTADGTLDMKTARVQIIRLSDGKEIAETRTDRIVYDDSLEPEN